MAGLVDLSGVSPEIRNRPLSVRIKTAMIGNGVSAPRGMIPLPPVKSLAHYSVTDNPGSGVPVHVSAAAQADVLISIPFCLTP
jgi:hypothetical protein